MWAEPTRPSHKPRKKLKREEGMQIGWASLISEVHGHFSPVALWLFFLYSSCCTLYSVQLSLL